MITTAVGNYPKIPSLSGGPNLRTAIRGYDQGRLTVQELRSIEEEATQDAIQEQVRAGLDLVTDGLLRWEDEVTYFARGLTGVTLNGLIRWFDSNTYYRQPVVEGPLAWQEAITAADYQFAAAHSPRPLKAVLPGPLTVAAHVRDVHYREFEKLLDAVVEALNLEARALEAAGATFIQFNEPVLVKSKERFPLFQQAASRLVAGLTAKTALYSYFGDIEGLYPAVLDTPFQVFGLDFVDGPANFNVLKTFPSDRELGAGLVDARNTKLESVEELVASLDQIRSVVPLDRVYLSPNCGLEYLPRQSAYEKLVRVVAAGQRAQEVLA